MTLLTLLLPIAAFADRAQARRLYNEALNLQKGGLPGQALELFQASLDADPSFYHGLKQIGAIHYFANRKEETVIALEKFLEYEPGDKLVQRYLARARSGIMRRNTKARFFRVRLGVGSTVPLGKTRTYWSSSWVAGHGFDFVYGYRGRFALRFDIIVSEYSRLKTVMTREGEDGADGDRYLGSVASNDLVSEEILLGSRYKFVIGKFNPYIHSSIGLSSVNGGRGYHLYQRPDGTRRNVEFGIFEDITIGWRAGAGLDWDIFRHLGLFAEASLTPQGLSVAGGLRF